MTGIRRWVAAVTALGLFVGVAYVAQEAQPPAARMADAAGKFLAALKPEQKAKAVFPFEDNERFNWHFIPLQDNQKRPTRKGLPLEEMTPEQKQAALDLLKAGLSPDGYAKATTIMSLEAILRDLEKGGGLVRNPEWYFVSVFGTPARTGKWGWRVEGHHLSVNMTLDNGEVVSSTPAFFGANPATVKDGPRKGLRTLPEVEDLAVRLFKSLNDEQRKAAHQPKQFPEVKAQNKRPDVGEPVGLAAGQMTGEQRETLRQLLTAYTRRMPEPVGRHEQKLAEDAGLDKVRFAFAGGTEPGQPHTYRLYGPTFVVEFLNVQEDSAKNPANHIHSVWRSTTNDFGLAAR